MGILRATKYKTFLKLSAAVFLLSAVIGTGLFTSLKVSALPPEIPMSWADSAHANAVDNKGNVYGSVGYGCVVGSLTVIGGDGKSISNDSGLGKNITASDKSSIPGCNSGSAAQYIWLYTDTTTSNSARYALIVYPGGKPVNPKSCVVTASPAKNSTECSAAIWKVDTSSGALNNPPVKSSFGIKLDTSTQAAVTNAITNNNQSSSLNASCPENAFSWMICPVISMAVGAANTFDGQITCLMQIDLSDVFGASSNDTNPYRDACGTSSDIATIAKTSNAYYHAWNTFRSLALALIVIAGLIMVISQAAGAELLDAYAIRKILPRLLIAGVAITLSWQLMEFLIQLTNVVGYGVRDIIYYPFNSFSGLTISGIGASLLGLMATGGAIIALGAPGLLLLALTAVLGAVVAFITLILRKLVIIFLLMLAPLAIACYILPNTQKVWKMWWDTLSKALIMFPIIAAMIAVGHVFAATSYGSGGGGAISQTIAFIAYFLPYFMIPTAVRMAGGAVGSIGGMISKASQGGFSTLKKAKGNQVAKNWHDIKSGNRFQGGTEHNIRGKLNRTLQTGTLIPSAGANPTRWKSKIGEAKSRDAELQRAAMMEDKDYSTWNKHDTLNRAASETSNRKELREALINSKEYEVTNPDGSKYTDMANLDRDVERVEKMRAKYEPAAFKQATFFNAVAGGTAYKESADIWKAASEVAGNDNGVLSTLVGTARGLAMSAGRVDQGGGGFGDTFKIASSFRNRDYTLAEGNQAMADAVIKSQGSGIITHSSMKPRAIENLIPEYKRRLAAAANSGDQDTMDRELAVVANLYDGLASNSPQNAKIIADQLLRWDPLENVLAVGSIGPTRPTVQELIESQRGSTTFQSTRRELNAQQQASQQFTGNVRGNDGTPSSPNIAPKL